MAKKFNANQHNNEEKRTPRINNRKPEYSEDQKTLANYFVKNIKDYLAAYELMQAGEIDDMSQPGRDLMTLPDRASYVSNDMLGVQVECNIHLLLRSVRNDRETGELSRATATFAAIDEYGNPGYVVDMYLNKNYTGMVSVTPITATGPKFRNTYRVEVSQTQG